MRRVWFLKKPKMFLNTDTIQVVLNNFEYIEDVICFCLSSKWAKSTIIDLIKSGSIDKKFSIKLPHVKYRKTTDIKGKTTRYIHGKESSFYNMNRMFYDYQSQIYDFAKLLKVSCKHLKKIIDMHADFPFIFIDKRDTVSERMLKNMFSNNIYIRDITMNVYDQKWITYETVSKTFENVTFLNFKMYPKNCTFKNCTFKRFEIYFTDEQHYYPKVFSNNTFEKCTFEKSIVEHTDICPITFDQISKPVYCGCPYNHIMEDEAIKIWTSKGNNTCPLSRKKISISRHRPYERSSHISSITIHSSNFENCVFRNMKFIDINFTDCTLRGVKFISCELQNIDFEDSDLDFAYNSACTVINMVTPLEAT